MRSGRSRRSMKSGRSTRGMRSAAKRRGIRLSKGRLGGGRWSGGIVRWSRRREVVTRGVMIIKNKVESFDIAFL